MLSRILAVLGVGIWCLFILLVSIAFVIDRGLADVGVVWLAVFGIGVVAPVLLLGRINRAIAAHEASRRAGDGTREQEKELLGALEARGELTPATAAMRTSLTVDEASKMLEGLARKGHLELQTEEGVIAYSLSERDRRELPASDPAPPRARSGGNGASAGLEEPLSERELEVLRLIAEGASNQDIARRLVVSPATAKTHVNHIFGKLDAESRVQVVARARALGLLPQ